MSVRLDTNLEMRIAPESNSVAIKAEGATLSNRNGFYVLDIPKNTDALVKLFIMDTAIKDFGTLLWTNFPGPESLT